MAGVKVLRRVLVVAVLAILLMRVARHWQPEHKPVAPRERVVIMVGLDGYRADYLQKFRPPVLSRLAKEGVTAQKMISCFPTLTFPNLYSLATGLRPESHGVINNHMHDPEFGASFALGTPSVTEGRWWGGEPVWLTAQRQGVKSACMFWPGSEAEIGGRRPDEWRLYNGQITARDRVQTVLDWLSRPVGERPGLITLYFHEADTAGHRHGPDSPEMTAAIREIDAGLQQLLDGIAALGLQDTVNLVCVADHGMTELDPQRTIPLGSLVDMETVAVDFAGAIAGLRPLDGGETAEAMVARLRKSKQHFQVFLREEMPERFHFRDHRRIPPVMLLADEGWFLVKRPLLTEGQRQTFLKATHGFDPELPSMAATFVAWGPAFNHGLVLPPFENIEVYALVCATLGIEPASHDGKGTLASQVLKP